MEQTLLRRQHIEKILKLVGFARVRELAERLGVSEVTIRKDLIALEADGRIVRSWGGARITREVDILQSVDVVLHGTKQRLVPLDHASELITEGSIVYLDHGDRCVLIARTLKHMSLDVITTSFSVMEELVHSQTVRVHTPGGSYSRVSGSFDGTIPDKYLQSLLIDICFIQLSGFHQRSSKEKMLIEQVMQRSAKRIILTRIGEFSTSAHNMLSKYRPEYIVV